MQSCHPTFETDALITFWSKDHYFNASQLSLTWNHVIEIVDCDWLIVVNADYVFFDNGIDLKKELKDLSDELVVKFNRFKNVKGQPKYDDRGIILNIKKIREDSLNIGFCRTGPERRMSDFPGIIKEKTSFKDINGCIKTIYAGERISRDHKSIPLECGVYGHFFFTLDQCLYKCKRWDEAIARSYGRAMEPDKYIKLKHKLFKPKSFYSKEEVLSWKHPESIKRLINIYLNENMIGMMKTENKSFDRLKLFLYRIKTKFKSIVLKKRGLLGLEEEYNWVSLNNDKKMFLDLEEFYGLQDKTYNLNKRD